MVVSRASCPRFEDARALDAMRHRQGWRAAPPADSGWALARPPQVSAFVPFAYRPRNGFAARNCFFQIHRACLTSGIGFVWCAGFHRWQRQRCRPLPTAVQAGIGFVWPRPVVCPICHNSCSAKYLPLLLPGRELGLFRTIAFSIGSTPNPPRQRLFQPGRGKLGSFGAIGPNDGPTNACAGPCLSLSVSANWLRFARLRSEYRAHADRTGLSWERRSPERH